ncbi:carboxylesterase type B [Streptococcus criceti]|uniref:Carboxylic ester hydrolase n=1 Tax=Streptococcus criceti HS-6 TaxID=873449 RepID=G5JNM6_STRCG|nr:carboxylesterase family protein [Streptococcus criceti]EHI73562.1 para-nitrobenzyl esterase family protein [Streptococcus criceti HS-6]SUN43280.1 carboxylesterase type B [Streptococcus criceti]
MSKQNKKFPNVREWLGVPYARAERFKKPTLLPYDASQAYDQSGPAAMQTVSVNWLTTDKGLSEDCLNLSIWAPERVTEPLPVVVYTHGGGWTIGSNTQDTSDLSGLVSSGKVIGVAINYRLGALGWLSLSQYGGALKDATNLGLQDIVVALQWIQENIAQFGGDPKQVTLTGHSAGAYNSLALLGVKGTQGLFHRIVAFSGFPSRYVPRWFAEELADRTLKKLQLDNPEELLSVDAETLLNATMSCLDKDPIRLHALDNRNIGMVADWDLPNGVFARNPYEVIASGERSDIDILISSTTYEVGWYVLYGGKDLSIGGLDALVDELVEYFHVPRLQAEKIVQFHYQEGMPFDELRALIYTSFSFTLPATRSLLNHAKAGGRAYQLNIGPAQGALAVHGTEMYGIVGQEAPNASQEQKERDQFVSQTVLNMALGQFDQLWTPVTELVEVKDIGQRPFESNTYIPEILNLFEGVQRT